MIKKKNNIYTKEMIEEAKEMHSIDAVAELEEMLVEELYKASTQGKIESREKKIDELLDETEEE